MHRVLMPVDGSESALRAATQFAALARQLQKTEVLLLNVQSPVAMHDRIIDGRPSELQHLEAPLREAAGKLFAPTRKVLDEAGIAHAEHVEFGGGHRQLREKISLQSDRHGNTRPWRH